MRAPTLLVQSLVVPSIIAAKEPSCFGLQKDAVCEGPEDTASLDTARRLQNEQAPPSPSMVQRTSVEKIVRVDEEPSLAAGGTATNHPVILDYARNRLVHLHHKMLVALQGAAHRVIVLAGTMEPSSSTNSTATKHGVILDFVRNRLPLTFTSVSGGMGLVWLIPLIVIVFVILLVFLMCLWQSGSASVEQDKQESLVQTKAQQHWWTTGRSAKPPQQPTSFSPSVIQGLLRPSGGGRAEARQSPGIATPLSWVRSEAPQSELHGKTHASAMSVAQTDGLGSDPKLSIPLPLAQATTQRKHLCPGLVVPENNECTLLLPEISRPAQGPNYGTLSIDNLSGVVVLLCKYTLTPALLTGQGEKRLELKSAMNDEVLVSCRDTSDRDASGNPAGLIILNKSEEASGILKPNSQGTKRDYMVVLGDGQKVLLRRDLQRRPYATDENSWLLACTEDSERGRVVRISPQVDAGLMALAMLGTDLLELRAAAGQLLL